MFIINNEKKEAVSIKSKSFQELGYTERNDLQEWIRKNPEILGEELLVIQKEFSGFGETNERLDLLATDKQGNLVIIENKTDDAGRDVTWQALKYVSYCSRLSITDIIDIFQQYLIDQKSNDIAEERLADFFGVDDFSEVAISNDDQRIILVAARFRKEVTSTVMWLIDHGVRIKCIQITPYEFEDYRFLETEQIIPIKDAEDYLIKIANKKQVERDTKEKNQRRFIIRHEFWTELLGRMNAKTTLFSNISPSTDNWINCGIGYGGLSYSLVITGKFARIDLYINKNSQAETKEIFDSIIPYKDQIESIIGTQLDWERLDDAKASRIAYYLRGVSVFNKEERERMIEFFVNNISNFDKAMKEVLPKVIKK